MSILENAVNQAIEDFDGIQSAANIPDGVPTREYDESIAENERKIYDKGYSQSESDFWDYITKKGKRTVYTYAFRNWDCEYIRPPYQLKVSSAAFMFQNNPSLKIVEKAYFDFSTLSNTAVNDMVQACSSLVTFEDVGIGAMTNYSYLFSSCSSLKTIECLRFSENTTSATNIFAVCTALENIIIEGEICISLSFSYSSLLTQDSINSIIDHLADLTGQTARTVTFHSTVSDNLTEEQYNKIINKNWKVG